jgi:hypothetical protein
MLKRDTGQSEETFKRKSSELLKKMPDPDSDDSQNNTPTPGAN